MQFSTMNNSEQTGLLSVTRLSPSQNL